MTMIGKEPEFLKATVVGLDEVFRLDFYAKIHFDGLELIAKYSNLKIIKADEKTLKAL